MKRVILLISILLALTALAYSRSPAKLSGPGGISLLGDLINSSENLALANNTTANASYGMIRLSGANGTALLSNLTDNPANLSWGSKSRTPPQPPSYADMLYAQVIHDNRE